MVILETVDDVAVLRLNCPESLNALSTLMLSESRSALERARRQSAKSLLITGTGRAFSAGGDISDDAMTRGDPGAMLETAYHPLFRALADLDIPVVSAINGPAAGAGMALALAADLSVMARSAFLQASFVNLGLVPDCGLSGLLARTLGRTRALELALLGQPVPAERALALGLVTRVVDDEACFDEALALARRLAEGPAIAIGLIRRQIAAALDTPLADMLAIESANQSRAARTADFREGVAAFREKRPPHFQGH